MLEVFKISEVVKQKRCDITSLKRHLSTTTKSVSFHSNFQRMCQIEVQARTASVTLPA